MKRLLNISLCLLMMLGLIDTVGIRAEVLARTDDIIRNDKTGIPDQNLYNALIYECDYNNDGILTKEEAKRVGELSINNGSIKMDGVC